MNRVGEWSDYISGHEGPSYFTQTRGWIADIALV